MEKLVFLDLDDTILDFHRSEAEALSHTLISLGINPSDEIIDFYSKVNDSQWKLLEKGQLTRDEVLTRRFEIFFDGINVSQNPLEVRLIYEKNLSESAYYLPQAKELLEYLSKKYSIYAMSNGTSHVQAGRIKRLSLDHYFKNIFISEQIGYNKPDVRFFERCFSLIGDIDRQSAVIIGDSISSDIKGGLNAGIHTILFAPNGFKNDSNIKPDIAVNSLSAVPDAIERVFN